MANKVMNARVQLKHGTTSDWAASSFVPMLGEVVLYTDVKKYKIGDGTTLAKNLNFASIAELVDLGITATAAELNVLDGITASTAELNVLDGITASTEELNVLDGITASTEELNYVDGVTSAIQTQLNNKQEKITASGVLQGDGSGNITAKAVDTTVTSESSNLVTSGAVYSAISATKVVESTVSGWGFTKNEGTITNVATGTGLSGGPITTSGTIALDMTNAVDGKVLTATDSSTVAWETPPVKILHINSSNATKSTTKTYGVAPYNTSYYYTNFTINGIDESVLADNLILVLECDSSFGCTSSSYRNCRIRFGTSGTYIPIFMGASIAAGNTYIPANSNRILSYRTTTISGVAYNNFSILSDSYTAYYCYSFGLGLGTCTTAEATTDKVVTFSGYKLQTGSSPDVQFTYAVPANATLNINSTGAKPIYYNGAAIIAGIIKAGDIAHFVYNGTNYILTNINTDISHISNTSNPHDVTAKQVGLGNVDNTDDATKKLNFTGSIASGNTGFVTGDEVYTAIGNIETLLAAI